ncbi:hypothetical protein BDR04DRAFT_1158332 [Suillus decipiens]|nr:hypothetical protein BDR04DRAFT_1158332 [Suillus decipiens]
MPGIRSQEPCVEDKKGKLSVKYVLIKTMLMLTESTLFFVNLTSKFKLTNSKFSLAGHVNGWVSNVAPDERSKASSTSKSHTAASLFSLAHGPPSTQVTSVSGVNTKSSHQPKVSSTLATTNKPVPEVLVGGFADDTLDDSQEHLEIIASKTKEKTSFIKDDVENDMENDVEVLEDDFNPNEGVKMSKDSDSGNYLSFHHPNYKKHKLASVHTKPHRVLMDLLSSDEELEAPLTAVVGAVTKRAMWVTSSTSVAVSKAAATGKPPAKKVKTEEGANDNTKPMLIPLPSHLIANPTQPVDPILKPMPIPADPMHTQYPVPYMSSPVLSSPTGA